MKTIPLPSQSHLQELFRYDEISGSLYRKDKPHKPAGTLTGKGHLMLRIDSKPFYVHRIIYALHFSVVPDVIDHIDGNPLNNKLSNLRAASLSENGWNSKLRSDNLSGCKGVSAHQNKWRVRWTVNGNKFEKSGFPTIEKANDFAKQMRSQHHGEFAKHE